MLLGPFYKCQAMAQPFRQKPSRDRSALPARIVPSTGLHKGPERLFFLYFLLQIKIIEQVTTQLTTVITPT